jgi:hypothetical protein
MCHVIELHGRSEGRNRDVWTQGEARQLVDTQGEETGLWLGKPECADGWVTLCDDMESK